MDADSAKKWGTVFMGRREASLDKLDSMQSAALQQQHQKQVQEDYLERVKSKATERAKEVLGAAYAERQHILQEAEADAQQRIRELTAEAAQLHNAAAADRTAAAQEKQQAETLTQEARRLRDSAYGEGYDAGVEKARAELAEFRAQMGDALGAVMLAIQRESSVIFDKWRGDLVTLCRVAVEKGINLALSAEHRAVLEHMLMQAVRQLEDHRIITLRVHPDDEDVVGDMFLAAREQLPHVQEWRVRGDATLEAGSIVAESADGSVDNRLEYYRELVDSVMSSLHLPAGDEETEALARIAGIVQSETERITGLTAPQAVPAATAHAGTADDVPLPPPFVPQAGESAVIPPSGNAEFSPNAMTVQPAGTSPADNDFLTDTAPFAAQTAPNAPTSDMSAAFESADTAQAAMEYAPQRTAAADAASPNAVFPPVQDGVSADAAGADAMRSMPVTAAPDADAADAMSATAGTATPFATQAESNAADISGRSAPADAAQTAAPYAPHPATADTAASADVFLPPLQDAAGHAPAAAASSTVNAPARSPASPAAPVSQSRPVNLAPSLAELEDELFADTDNERDTVLATGGFLTPDQPA